MDFDQKDITDFFEKSFQDHLSRRTYMKGFTRSGYGLINRIPRDAHILDVGCGQNLFKPYFPNLVGIDVIGTECDVKTSLLDYKSESKFDVVLCLGSIYGSLNDIRLQINHIKTMLADHSKIYWRTHPAIFKIPGVVYPPWLFPWTEQTHHQLTSELGFTLNEVCKDYIKRDGQLTEFYRIYAEWTLN